MPSVEIILSVSWDGSLERINVVGKKEKSKGFDKPAREREERKEIGGITSKLSAKEVELVSPRAQGLYFEINRKTLNSFTCHSTYNEI